MNSYIDEYLRFLRDERRVSRNTLDAYRRDVNEFVRQLEAEGLTDAGNIKKKNIVSYLDRLRSEGRSQSTMGRKTSSVRSYVTFLHDHGVLDDNPSIGVKPHHISRRDVEYLTIEEVNRLLEAPDDSRKGMRDRAILEVLYGTGVRVTELITMKMSEVNLTIGFVTCRGDYGKARIIPLGGPCRAALERYIEKSRPGFLAAAGKSDAGEKDGEYIFLNVHGEKLTRQGLWKIVSGYSEKAGLDHRLTPQVIRNSFAVHMLQNGADVRTMQELMGFEDPATLQGYLNVTRNRIKEVFDKTHPRA